MTDQPERTAWNPQRREAEQALFKNTLKRLRSQAVYVVAQVSGMAFVSYKGVIYSLADNGGEINVERVNWEFSGAAPMYWHDELLNPETMMYRVLALMKGDEVDWQLRLEEVPPEWSDSNVLT